MKGFLGDGLRLAWALIYWNGRKSLYRLGGAQGQCPCQNPSDSGEGGRTGCEAAAGWRDPARFRRVCPLLVRRADGGWVCSVDARAVRPFWGRAFGWYGGAVAGLAVIAGLAVFSLMRVIGYEVSPRQVFWPPAWRELRTVQSELFIAQAREHFAAGRVREALTALGSARDMNPRNYAASMMLAQFHRVGHPAMADGLYAQLLAGHPDRAVETARVWYLSLLSRGQLGMAAELAALRLVAEPDQAAAWTHALVFTSRRVRQPDLAEAAGAAAGAPREAARVLRFDAQLQREPAPDLRRQMLRAAPLPENFPYAWAHRAEQFIAAGFPGDALEVLRTARDRGVLGGRDLLPLVLAARATAGDTAGLEREVAVLVEKGGPAELQVLALHLTRYPRGDHLAAALTALERIPEPKPDDWQATGLTLFCAAGVGKDPAGLKTVREKLQPAFMERQAGLDHLGAFFLGRQHVQAFFAVLPLVDPIPLELLYVLLDRYIGDNSIPAVDRPAGQE